MGKQRQKSPEPVPPQAKSSGRSAMRSRSEKRESAFSRYTKREKPKRESPPQRDHKEESPPRHSSKSPPPKRGKIHRDPDPSETSDSESSDSDTEITVETKAMSLSPSPKKISTRPGKKSPRSASGTWEISPRMRDSKDNQKKIVNKEVSDESLEDSPDAAKGSYKRKDEGRRDRGHNREDDRPRSRDRDRDRRSKPETSRLQNRDERQAPPEIRTFDFDECVILVTKYPEAFCVWGQANLKCLYGEVNILGSTLRQGSKGVDIFSPNTNSLVTISTQRHNGLSKEDNLKNALDKISTDNEQAKTDIQFYCSLDNDSVVLQVRKTRDKTRLDFISSVPQYQQIFWSPDKSSDAYTPLGSIPMAVYVGPDRRNLRLSGEMKNFANKFCSDIAQGNFPVACVCGGQNVGKSTFGRYIVNSVLNNCKRIAFLECDVGQTEYSPPGCVSLHVLTSPVIGPPFTHQRSATKMIYFGAVSPGDDPRKYLKCVRHAYSAYTSLEQPCPLLVNTMGWNKGLGLVLLASTVRCINPKYIVQIMSSFRNKNFPEITPQFIDEQDTWPDTEMRDDVQSPTHDLVLIDSVVSVSSGQGRFHPADHRTLSLLGYLSRLQPSAGPCVPLHGLTPQCVAWSRVAVHVAHTSVPNSHILYALNASIVALCTVPEEMMVASEDETLPKFLSTHPVCHCLGFGIVRAIDTVNKTFMIISDIKLGPESTVNCLVRGIVELPQALISSQPSVNGEIPYYGESKAVIGATAIKKRRHLLRHGQTGNKGKQEPGKVGM